MDFSRESIGSKLYKALLGERIETVQQVWDDVPEPEREVYRHAAEIFAGDVVILSMSANVIALGRIARAWSSVRERMPDDARQGDDVAVLDFIAKAIGGE